MEVFVFNDSMAICIYYLRHNTVYLQERSEYLKMISTLLQKNKIMNVKKNRKIT